NMIHSICCVYTTHTLHNITSLHDALPISDGVTHAVLSQNSKAPTARRPPEDRQKQIAANRRLFTGVVSGIAHYGNCIGIPTIGGVRKSTRLNYSHQIISYDV